MVRRQVTRTRKDIADWKSALNMAERINEPKYYKLIDLYNDALDDALLSSQINNRFEVTVAAPFELIDDNGNVADEQTKQLNDIPIMQDLVRAILDSEMFGNSLVEFSEDQEHKYMALINRRNVDYVNGRVYLDILMPAAIDYRELNEFGKFIVEFNAGHIGIINKCIPHVLFKKFAQSCWSELCEIYGIPPRFIKTNTQDPEMLDRAERMVRDMGAAAGFVIDTTEEFSFAQGVTTSGEVYENLINKCNSEISMLISGAIIGQDTANGNYSKEESSKEILMKLVESDQRMVCAYMNDVVLPAFRAMGWLTGSEALKFRFSAVENAERLWEMVKEILPYKDVDSAWMEEKFGIPVRDKQQSFGMSAKMGADLGFFV